MQISKVAVVGAGTMGASIAVAVSASGFPVVLKDVNDDAVKAGLDRIDRLLASRVKKGLAQDEADNQRSLIEGVVNYEPFPDVDLVIEAVAENLDVKQSVLQELDENCNVHAIFAT